LLHATTRQNLHSRLLQARNLASNFFTHLDQITPGTSKPKCSWQHLTTSILLVLNKFRISGLLRSQGMMDLI